MPVAGTLPDDRKTAGVLSDGAGSRRSLHARPLLRAAAVTGRTLRGLAAAAAPDAATGTQGLAAPGLAGGGSVTGLGPRP